MKIWIRAAALVSAASFAASAIAAEGGTEAASLAASAAPGPPSEEKAKAFVGVGVGTGTARYKVNGTTKSFSDTLQGSVDESPFIAVKVVTFGIAVKPNLFAGADLTGVAQSGTNTNTDTNTLQISNYFASLTWFPWETGLFLKGAAGVSSFFIASGSQSDRSWGLGALVSAGFALRISGAHHLMLSAEQGWQTYWGSSATKPDSSLYNAAYLGYLWRN
jgi:hypothetical protein